MSGSGWLVPPLASPQGSEKHWGFGKSSSLRLPLQSGDTTNHLWFWFPQGPWGWGLECSRWWWWCCGVMMGVGVQQMMMMMVMLRGHEGHGHWMPWQRLALRNSSARGSRLAPIRCGHGLGLSTARAFTWSGAPVQTLEVWYYDFLFIFPRKHLLGSPMF